MRDFRSVLVCFLWLTVMMTAPLRVVAATMEPMEFVRRAVNEIVTVLQDEALVAPGRESERKAKVIGTVEKYFDFKEMSRRTLARHWRELSPAEQERFVSLFKQLLEKTYIDRVDSYCKEKMGACADEAVIIKKQDVRGNRAVVYTSFLQNNTEVPVAYKLKEKGSGWMVYDVVIEGVSLVRNYRSQFEEIIEREKYAGLLARMEEKIAKQKDQENQ